MSKISIEEIMTDTGNTTITDGSLASVNCVGNILSGAPYYGGGGGTIAFTGATYFPYQIRKAANGFIINVSGVEHVFETVERLLSFIGKELKAK
jgi:hypothetical protein